MDQDILSEILSNYHPPLTGSLLSDLPPRQTRNGHDSAIQSLQPSTNVKLSNPNQAGAVISKIEDIFESIADCILDEKKEMTIRLKTRKRKGNQVHDAESGAIKSVSDEKERSVRFPSRSPQEAWKFAALLRILELSHEALATGIVTTKRDIYYRDPELFMKQAVVDRYVDDIAYTLGVERDALNVVAAAKGLVAGSFSITRQDSSIVNYSSEPEGVLVPNIKEINAIKLHHVKWVLVIEKEATFRTLSTSQYHKESLAGNGIILTAKGYPDISTRHFLHLLSSLPQNVPIFGLVDFDPDGLGILSTYKYGSVALAHENINLAVPRIQWLGVKSADIVAQCDPSSSDRKKGKDKVGLLKLSDRDRRIARRMLEKECFKEGGREMEWRRELQAMLMLNVKAEIQILSEEKGGLPEWLDIKLENVLGEKP